MPLSVLTLLGRELGEGGWRRLLFLATASGFAGAAVLAIINVAANSMGDPDGPSKSLALLVISLVVYVYSQSSLMVTMANTAERTVHRLRLRLLDTFNAAELIDMEGLSRNEIFSCVSTEIRVISDGATSVVILAQSVILAITTMAYLALLSFPAFLIAVSFIAFAVSRHVMRNRDIVNRFESITQLNAKLLDSFSDLVDGFKEVKLNTHRATELSADVIGQSAALSARQLELQTLFARVFVTAQVNFYLLASIMVFIVPTFASIGSSTLPKIATTTLFLTGPIATIVGGLPALQRVNAAADAIMILERKLRELKPSGHVGASAPVGFKRIGLSGAVFRYPPTEGESGFGIGPVDIEISRGTIAFITGGNGSGKSTLLRMITGLYLPNEGVITLDGRAVEIEDVVGYRNLFSAIFADHHLFRTLYGISPDRLVQATEYLRLMELEHKVAIVNHTFSTLALSSGQRKRLALIVALLEDRPVYVFDEWAADQDPHFRRKFYREVLPSLKSAGKVVVAVTHDERYFDAADTRYHMEEGGLQLTSDEQYGVDR